MNRDEREYQVLAAVVRLYSETGQPVSSALVVRWLRGVVSSATIRADMARLEEGGLLVKPHTSAGRVPTDTGFRRFVNRLLRYGPFETTGEQPAVPRLGGDGAAPAMIKDLAALLSRLTANVAIILGPAWDTVRAERLELYPKEGRRVLMVLVLENALVRTGTFRIECDLPPGVLQDAAAILSERVCSRTVREIREGALDDLGGAGDPAGDCARDLASRGGELFGDVEEGDLELMGVANLLDEPELSEPGHLRKLVRFLESPRTIRDTLRRLSPENEDGVAVWIGSENPVDDLRSFSLVSSPFDLAGRQGVLAVLGLRRMSYDRTIRSMQALARSLRDLDDAGSARERMI